MKFAPSSIRLSFGDRHTIILDPPREKFSLKIHIQSPVVWVRIVSKQI